MSHEIELKLALPHSALPALRRHPLFAGAAKQGRAVTLENTYFDTPELALKARKVGLRTRRQGRVWLQTVKCAAESTGGLTRRPEWEGPYTGRFDFGAVDDPALRQLLARHEAALVPLFTTRFRRETRLYAPDETVRILMMLDTGEVRAGERSAPLCELELELVEGQARDLLALACALAADLPLWPEDASKAARGYRLRSDEPPAPMHAAAITLDPAHSACAAFRALAEGCLRQWQANAAGALTSDDSEFIHQLRVALRRLRSLLQLFAPALPGAFVSEWKPRLRDEAAALGEARDLDVLDQTLLAAVLAPGAGGDAYAHDLAALADHLHARRNAAREAVRAHLDPATQGRTLLAFSAALLALPSEATETAAPSLAEFGRTRLARLRKQARRRLAAADPSVPSTLHALRIAVKRLRYGLEFFASLLPRKPARRQLVALSRVQQELGFIHDVDVAAVRLAAWAAERPQLGPAVAFVRGWHAPRHRRAARRALKRLIPLLRGAAFWKA